MRFMLLDIEVVSVGGKGKTGKKASSKKKGKPASKRMKHDAGSDGGEDGSGGSDVSSEKNPVAHEAPEVGGDEVTLWGVSERGDSVCVHASGFSSFFWFPAPATCRGSLFQPEDCPALLQALKAAAGVCRQVVRVELSFLAPLFYYRPSQPGPQAFLKLSISHHKFVKRVAAALTSLSRATGLCLFTSLMLSNASLP